MNLRKKKKTSALRSGACISHLKKENLKHMKAAHLNKQGRCSMLLKIFPPYTFCICTALAAFLVIGLYTMRITVSDNQVFINYRGDEVGYNFVSHLTDAFERHGIKFFLDKYEQRGKDLKHLLVRIEESRIGLVIFSTRYPESKWCMNELVKMREREDEGKLLIIPIFYKVEPSDVTNHTRESEFGNNFWRLMEASHWTEPTTEWRRALERIPNLMGLSLREKSSEAEFVKKIVEAVEEANKGIGLVEEENSGAQIKEKYRKLQLPI